MKNWLKALYVILVGATLVMAFSALWLILSLLKETQTIEANFRDNLIGMSAQAGYELHALIDALERFEDEEPGLDREAVIERFDVFWSRLETNSSGVAGTFYLALEGAEEALRESRRALRAIEPKILVLEPGDRQTAGEIAGQLRPLLPLLYKAFLNAGTANSAATAELYADLQEADFWARVLLPGMIVSGIAVIAILWLDRRELNRLALSLQQRVDDRTKELQLLNDSLRSEIDNRIMVEEALREREAILNAVIENVPLSLSLKDREGRFILVNAGFERLHGISAAEALGKTFFDILPREIATDAAAEDRLVLDSGEPLQTEYSWPAHLGDQHELIFKFPLRLHAKGPITGLGVIALDITERKRAEEALKLMEKRLIDAIESITDGFVYYDPDQRLIYCNEKYREFYPWIEDVLVPGARLANVARTAAERGQDAELIADVGTWVKGRIEQFTDGSQAHEQHLRDGRWLLCSEGRTSDGGYVGIRTDITERKRMEETLKESEERFRAFIENSPAAILIKDVQGRYLTANKRWHDWFNPESGVILGRTVFDFYPEDHARAITESDKRILETGTPLKVELETPFADGTVRSTLMQKFPIFDPSGAITAIGGMNTDITDQKDVEKRLNQAQKMEAVGQLTGGVAHDFNNLLMVIQGNTELLAERAGIDNTLTGPILRAAARGSELTQRLLAFSRQQPLRPRSIDLGDLVSEMSELLTRTLGETIDIDIRAAPELWPAAADPGQVENALLNLALNARDAMQEGGKLTIECANAPLGEAYAAQYPEATAGDYLALAVSDNGIGMSAEVRAHAFDPFFTTKEVGQGSGLGLSMVYGFAKQSGGHVNIYSEEDQGTTVKLYLPRAEAAVTEEDVNREAAVPRGRGESVLVIEDDADVRAVAVTMLEGLDYRVVEAVDAAAAGEVLAERTQVDLVLSDVVLPGGVSGPEFAEAARRSHPDLKIIFMSGYPAEAAKRNGFLESDRVLLNKPFQRLQLAKALRQALDQ